MGRLLAFVVPVSLAGCIEIPGPRQGAADAAVIDAAVIDGAPPDAATCADVDGDHWPAGSGGVCDTLLDLDCDDDDAAIHPGARLQAAETVDTDCDESLWNGGGLSPPLLVNTVADDPQITARGVDYAFDETQAHAITSLRVVDGPELLHTSFSDERFFGVEAWSYLFSWAFGGLDGIQVLSNTDTVAQIRVEWQDGYQAGTDNDMNGVSLWTFHADGRVYRREQATVVTTQDVANVTSYVALAGQQFTLTQMEGQAAPVPLDIDIPFELIASNPAANVWLCAANDVAAEPFEIGMMSQPTAPASRPTERARITGSQTAGDESELLSLQYDWNFGGPQAPADGSYAVSQHIVTGITLEADVCETTALAANAWRSPPALSVTGGQRVTLADGTDDNADGFAEGVGYYEVEWQARPLQLTLGFGGATGRGVTFRIRDMPAGDPIVTRTDGINPPERLIHGQMYLTAVADDTRWLLVVMDPGDTLTITSP